MKKKKDYFSHTVGVQGKRKSNAVDKWYLWLIWLFIVAQFMWTLKIEVLLSTAEHCNYKPSVNSRIDYAINLSKVNSYSKKTSYYKEGKCSTA